MTLGLHNITSGKLGKQKDRLGRGDSSVSGNYSGRGQKGQKSRSGASGLSRIGMKKRLIAQTPKWRGFKSNTPKEQPVNLKQINQFFKEGEEVTPVTLAERGLINKKKGEVKILGDGKLSVKKLSFSGVKASKSAREQIEKMEGKITS